MTFSLALLLGLLLLLVVAGYLLRRGSFPVFLLAILAVFIAVQEYRHHRERAHLESELGRYRGMLHVLNETPAPPPSLTSVAEDTEEPAQPIDTLPVTEEDQDAALDALKQQYEELLVSYYYLRRCAQPHPALYYEIMTAMLDDLARADAPARMAENISLAARGSHQEMYAATACNPDHTNILEESMRNYLEQKGQERMAR